MLFGLVRIITITIMIVIIQGLHLAKEMMSNQIFGSEQTPRTVVYSWDALGYR